MIFWREIFNSLYFTNENLSTGFSTWNMDFSTVAFETVGTEIFPWNMKFLYLTLNWEYTWSCFVKLNKNGIFRISHLKICVSNFPSWNMECCIFNIRKTWHQFSHKKYGIFNFIHESDFHIWGMKVSIFHPRKLVWSFPNMNYGILYISHLKTWGQIFLIVNMKSQVFMYEHVSDFNT